MKYIAIIDDSKLKKILEEGVEVKPIEKPIVVITNGNSGYITQGHIDAMVEYEQRQQIESIQKDLAEMWQQSTSWKCVNRDTTYRGNMLMGKD